ncbi:beta/gamma crystallin domain-containing protein [Amycolatopsis sp. NPDC051061]|uniref:beta/gamma crystallin domain-containing protein n=1 Tax=Amycolatopsis sp. NPDC051061 TaxID=3155042 RepID=UPI003431C16E
MNLHARKAAVTLTAAAVALCSLFVTAGTASAATKVPCTGSDLLEIWWHSHSGDASAHECFANSGTVTVRAWVDKISTGNNDITYFDFNGSVVSISRWNIVTFPNNPPDVDAINIH